MQSAGPPDTSSYYHVAYVWVAAVYIGYSVLLWMRSRRLRRAISSPEERASSPRSGRDA